MKLRDQQNFKAKQLYSESAESLKGTDIVLDSTEPANYTGSYTRVRKRIVDTEIAMSQGSRRTVLTTAMQMLSLLKPTVSEKQEEEGGLRT